MKDSENRNGSKNSIGFGDRVVAAVKKKGAPICVGLDPRIGLLPGQCLDEAHDAGLAGDEAQARAFTRFCCAVIEKVAPDVAAVKPQAAFFETLGHFGMAAFEEVSRFARASGLLVVADVKRGDIGSTAQAYAQAYLAPRGDDPAIADACTVNPYLGSDGILPFIETGEREGGGVFVLVKTSNPSSVEIQDLVVDGDCVHIHTARLVDSLNDDRIGKTGYGPVGAVVGATWPDLVVTLRKILSRSILLLPGYGAQGAGAEDVARAFDSEGQGALVSASRSITFPWAAESSCPADWIDRIGQAADDMSRDLRKVSTFGA